MDQGELPTVVFQEAAYLAANPDVAAAVAQGVFESAQAHYECCGRAEGRSFSVELTREEKALYLVRREGIGLEIGPSHSPIAPKRDGFQVHILDHASASDLREKYATHGIDLGRIEEVDFVWSGQPLDELIGRTACYDWIIASHVIEHVPDLISFLQQCQRLLKPDGVLSLVIPDKRYCFDALGTLTSTGVVLDAWHERRTRPSYGQVLDHFVNAARRGERIAWDCHERNDFSLAHAFAGAIEQWEGAQSGRQYVDVHCWRFIPASFYLLLSDLVALKLLDLRVAHTFETNGCEFYASLMRGAEATPVSAEDRCATLVGLYGEQCG